VSHEVLNACLRESHSGESGLKSAPEGDGDEASMYPINDRAWFCSPQSGCWARLRKPMTVEFTTATHCASVMAPLAKST
jgi:hypothetical protein